MKPYHCVPLLVFALWVPLAHGQVAPAAAGVPSSKPAVLNEMPALIPRPVSMVMGEGCFTVTGDVQVVADVASGGTARQFIDYIKPATGFDFNITATSPVDSLPVIRFIQDQNLTRLGREGYLLSVSPRSIQLTAATQAGLFYAVQTLRQLLPVSIYSPTPVVNMIWSVPAVTIEDQPRFAWRGLMLDCGHDFQTKAFVLRFIDLMALHKYNQFHWHLTDVGTWSIEINGYPKLLDADTRGRGVKPGHYTQDDIREVVRYAAERHITIMPEIDLPGHLAPAILAYPGLECPVPRRLNKEGEPARPWEVCVGNDKTYAFVDTVLSQVADLFPGPYIHIGGDECPKGRWMRCPLCQAKMAKEKLPDGKALQSYFIKHLDVFLRTKGKKLVGWEEIMEGGLAPNATVMSWLSMTAGIAAAKAGHDVIMAPKQYTYLDYPLMSVYKISQLDPVPAELTAKEAGHILGAQGQMWTDGRPTEKGIDVMVHPRSAALAEVLWSPQIQGNYAELMHRLQAHVKRLDLLGVHYRPLMVGTPVGGWEGKKQSKAEVLEWPLTDGLSGPGLYQFKFEVERGQPVKVETVEVLQGGVVLAVDKASDATGSKQFKKHFKVFLPDVSSAPLRLRVTMGSGGDPKVASWGIGTVYIEKIGQ